MAQLKTDLWGKPRIPAINCTNCGKPKGNHKAKTLNCPFGLKHRTMGYTNYLQDKVYEPKMYQPKEKK